MSLATSWMIALLTTTKFLIIKGLAYWTQSSVIFIGPRLLGFLGGGLCVYNHNAFGYITSGAPLRDLLFCINMQSLFTFLWKKNQQNQSIKKLTKKKKVVLFRSYVITTSKCIGKESATKKIPGVRLEIEFCFARVPELVCRLNGVYTKLVSCFAKSFSNLILSYQARISILTIPPRNISSSFFFLLRP